MERVNKAVSSVHSPAVRAAALFRDTFGAEPAAVASAPGRVNLIGEHVDYHGGHVLPLAIAERTAVAARALPGRFRAVAENAALFPAGDSAWPPARSGQWYDYAAGAALFAAHGDPDGGFMLAVASDVPVGAGVSSSAALEVATAAAVSALAGAVPAGETLARVAHRAETEFVGVPCGMMDQLISACAPKGQALLIDCRSWAMSPVTVSVDLVLADSGERHALRDGGYAQRRREGHEAIAALRARWPAFETLVDVPPARLNEALGVLDEVLAKRVRHVVNENQRTRLAARALEAADPEGFGVLVSASHASLRDLYQCSTPRLDAIVAAARELPHVLGARLVGAGWGGAVLVVCRQGAGGAVAARLRGDTVLALPDVRTVVIGEGVRLEPRPAA
jgi:galactokinase